MDSVIQSVPLDQQSISKLNAILLKNDVNLQQPQLRVDLVPIVVSQYIVPHQKQFMMNKEDLLKTFSVFGSVTDAIVNNQEGFALVTFNNAVGAFFAQQSLDNYQLTKLGSTLKVKWVKQAASQEQTQYSQFNYSQFNHQNIFSPTQLKQANCLDDNTKYTCRFDIQIENDKEFQVARRLIGAKGSNMKRIIESCCKGTKCDQLQDIVKLRLRGRGSGFKEGPKQEESAEPLHLCVSSRFGDKYTLACSLVQELILTVYEDYKRYLERMHKDSGKELKIKKLESITGRRAMPQSAPQVYQPSQSNFSQQSPQVFGGNSQPFYPSDMRYPFNYGNAQFTPTAPAFQKQASGEFNAPSLQQKAHSYNEFVPKNDWNEQYYAITQGDGSYSCVYKVRRLEDSQDYALKKVKMLNLSDREKENALNEVRILASLKHKNVASYKQAFFDESSSSLCIIMEYADNGDVFQKICEHQTNGTFMKEKFIWKIFVQTIRGLKSLHDLKIFHRDMKSANIFLYKDFTAKLGDLNVSKVAKKGLLYTQTGTPYYASPEVWKDQPYDLKSDIWSMGCVLYEMCALVPPFRADDMNGLFKKVLKGQFPAIPSHYSVDLRTVIKQMLTVNPQSRPNCDQILEMTQVQKRMAKYMNENQTNIESESELLKTIKFSRNIFKLKLPQANYEHLPYATIPNAATKSKLEQEKQMLKQRIMGGGKTMKEYPSQASVEGDDEYEDDFEKEKPKKPTKKSEVTVSETTKQSVTRVSPKPVESKHSKDKNENTISIKKVNTNIKIAKKVEEPPKPEAPKKEEVKEDKKIQKVEVDQKQPDMQTVETKIRPLEVKEPVKETVAVTSIQKPTVKSVRRKSRLEAASVSPTKDTSLPSISVHMPESEMEDNQMDHSQAQQKKYHSIDTSQVVRVKPKDRPIIVKKEKKTILNHLEPIASRKELSMSPSNQNLSQDSTSQSPNQRLAGNSSTLANKKGSIQSSLLTNQNSIVNKASPSYRRIVNIYSMNPSKKKKPSMIGNPSQHVLNHNSSGSHSNIYRGDDVRARIQQLREEIAEDRAHSLENKHSVKHSNMNLPELKSVTPNITNVKHYYEVMNNGSSSMGSQSKILGKKQSYDRLVRLDQQLYHLYRNNGRKMDSIQPIRAQGNLKNRPALGIYYGYKGNNSINGDLDIQGRAMVNSKVVNNSYI